MDFCHLRRAIFAAFTAVAMCASAAAHAIVLDFEGIGASRNTAISQTYGDINGQLDVIWDGVGNTSTLDPILFWDTDYGGLNNVAWVPNSSWAEIILKPSQGYEVTLNTFELGAYVTDRNSRVWIFEGLDYPQDATSLLDTGVFNVDFDAPFQLSQSFTSDTGLIIQWLDPTFVAIDNIDFSVSSTASPVPVPAALVLLLSAMGLFGFLARKRQE